MVHGSRFMVKVKGEGLKSDAIIRDWSLKSVNL